MSQTADPNPFRGTYFTIYQHNKSQNKICLNRRELRASFKYSKLTYWFLFMKSKNIYLTKMARSNNGLAN